MKRLLQAMEELLKAYERTTPSIDQELVRRVLAAKEVAIKSGRLYTWIGLGLALLVLGTTGCSKKEDAPPPNNPHVAGSWSGNGTDEAIGYYNIQADFGQSGNSASGSYTIAGQIATIKGNIRIDFGPMTDVNNVTAMSLERNEWTVPDPSNANRVCSGTMTVRSRITSITNSAVSFHYTMSDCQGGQWEGGANLHKIAGTN